MVSIVQPQFLPETNAEVLSRYVVEGPLAMKAVLEDLLRERALITLYSAANPEEFVVSQILRADAQGIRLDFTTDESRRNALMGAGIVVVAFLDRIKIQFECRHPQVSQHEGLSVLVCQMPDRMHRIQRRDAFRVRPPVRRPVECVVRPTQGGGERTYRVLDVSASGVALMASADTPTPGSGEIWRHCRLEIPGYAPIPCDLEVRFVSEGLLGEAAGSRVGCEFHRPTPETQRAIQIYVMDVERISRARA